ncbi:MAG: hypothetical protein J6A01_02200 [Proteobacteria bacterium]|nr:hypothetical protein [Pseudomonadota bacterium]
MKKLNMILTLLICGVVFFALGSVTFPNAAFADDNDSVSPSTQNIVHDDPPENNQTPYYYDGNSYYYENDYSLRYRYIASMVTGGVLVAGGSAMGIAALTMDKDDDKRMTLGIAGAVALGVGAICLGIGGYFLHEWKTKDYAFSVAPTFNGAVFNMTF